MSGGSWREVRKEVIFRKAGVGRESASQGVSGGRGGPARQLAGSPGKGRPVPYNLPCFLTFS